jgi:hypothetical protein
MSVTDDKLPIVFKSRVGLSLVVLVGCVIAVVGGIAKITDDSFRFSEERWGPLVVAPSTSGWFMLVVGLPCAIYALVTIVRRCPRLRLDESGILMTRCFGEPVHIPWNELKEVFVRHAVVPGRRWRSVEMTYVVNDAGKEFATGVEREDVADTIRRVAARMKKAGET